VGNDVGGGEGVLEISSSTTHGRVLERTDVATGNASGLLSKAVRKGINLVRNITPERQIEAVRALISQ
jgi:hypothetical protein